MVYVYLEPLPREEKDNLYAFYCREDEGEKKKMSEVQGGVEGEDKSQERGTEARERAAEGGDEGRADKTKEQSRRLGGAPEDHAEEKEPTRQADRSTASATAAVLDETEERQEEEEKPKPEETSSPILLSCWRDRRLMRNRQFVCTLRGNHLVSLLSPGFFFFFFSERRSFLTCCRCLWLSLHDCLRLLRARPSVSRFFALYSRRESEDEEEEEHEEEAEEEST